MHRLISGEAYAKVIDVTEEFESQDKPMGLNTVKLLKVASSAFGLSAHATMKIAEHLYLSGFISYPRTESTAYSKNFNFDEILSAHKNHPEWGEYVNKLMEDGIKKPRNGNDAGDHPPITPVKCAKESQLGEQEWRLYRFITQNFLATISGPAKFKVTKIQFKIGCEQFHLKGKELEEKGYLAITPWLMAKVHDVEYPKFEIDQEYKIDSMTIKEGKTSAPGYLTESDLISCMEQYEIGTDASIPSHIKNIIDRGYVRVVAKKGRTLVPTNLGLALARGYCDIDSELILPKVRAYIEKSCNRVAKGELEYKNVVDHVLNIFKKKYDYFVEKIGFVDNYIKNEFINNIGTDKDDQFKDSKGRTKRPDELLGNPEDYKSYEHCTLFEEYKSKPLEKNPEIMCCNCIQGIMKVKSAKAKGKKDTSINLLCGYCKYQITCFKDHTKFEVLTTQCDRCESAHIRVSYPVKESPFPLSANQHTGCMYCDDIFKSLITLPPAKKLPEKKEENAPTNVGEDGDELPIVKTEEKTETPGIISKKKKKR